MGWPSLGPILQTDDGRRGIRSPRPVDTVHRPPHSAGSMAKPQTIRDLRSSGWQRKSVKQEMRDNLIARLKRGEAFLPGIVGYDETVVPQIENAILSGQDLIFLGERGQAKTRIRSEEHTSELQSLRHLVCRLLL